MYKSRPAMVVVPANHPVQVYQYPSAPKPSPLPPTPPTSPVAPPSPPKPKWTKEERLIQRRILHLEKEHRGIDNPKRFTKEYKRVNEIIHLFSDFSDAAATPHRIVRAVLASKVLKDTVPNSVPARNRHETILREAKTKKAKSASKMQQLRTQSKIIHSTLY